MHVIGSVYIFDTADNGATWTELCKLVASDGSGDDHLGESVALSGLVIVGGAWKHDISGASNRGILTIR